MSRIEHFAIYADDPTALKDFYVRAFGLHVIVENGGPPPAYFLADDHGWPSRSWHGRKARRTPISAGFAISRSGSTTSSPSAASSHSLGIVFEDETLVETDEMKTAFFKDPAGNRCQIVWRRKRLGSESSEWRALVQAARLSLGRLGTVICCLRHSITKRFSAANFSICGLRLGNLDPRDFAVDCRSRTASRKLPHRSSGHRRSRRSDTSSRLSPDYDGNSTGKMIRHERGRRQDEATAGVRRFDRALAMSRGPDGVAMRP